MSGGNTHRGDSVSNIFKSLQDETGSIGNVPEEIKHGRRHLSFQKNNQKSELEMIWRSQARHQRIALRPLVTLPPFPMLSCPHTGNCR